MAQADIGVNVFLIDAFTSPMGLVEGAMGLFASSLVSGMSAAGGMSEQLGVLAAKMAEQEAEMQGLKDAQQLLTDAFNAGNLTMQEYGAQSLNNVNAQAALKTEMENTAADSAILESQLGDLNSTLGILGGTLGAGIDFVAFTAGLVSADQAAADLTDTMNQMSIAGNLTDTQLQALQGYLFQVANTSIYTADQVGQGFSLLEEKGYGADQIMKGIGQDAINLSEAIGDSSSGATGATNLLASAMEIFKAKASESAHYADLLTFAYYNGVPSVDGLRSAFEQFGARAQMLKVPIDQMVAALDSLGRAGMTGSQAGTALNYSLQAIYAPITKTQHELEVLGIITANKATPAFLGLEAAMKRAGANAPKFDGTVNSLELIFKAGQKVGTIPLADTFYEWALRMGMINDQFYTADGKAKTFIDSLHILYTHLKGLNQEELIAAIGQLFNVRSSQGVTQLMNGLGQLDATYQKLKKSTDAQGLAQTDASKRTDSQNAKVKELHTTFTDFMAQTGQPLQDMFKNSLGGLNQFVGGLTTGNPRVHEFFTAFLSIGAVLGGLGLLAGIIALIAVFAGAIIGPILLVAGGIALAAAAFAGLFTWLQHTPAVMGPIQEIFGYIGKVAGPIFKEVGKTVMDSLGQLKEAIQPALPGLMQLGKILGAVGIFIVSVLGGVVVGAIRMFANVLMGVIHFVTGFVQVLIGVFNIVHGFITLLFGIFTGNKDLIHKGLSEMFAGAMNVVHGALTMILGLVQTALGGVIGFITGFFQGFLHTMGSIFMALPGSAMQGFGLLLKVVGDGIGHIGDWFGKLPGMIGKFMGDLAHTAISWGENLINMLIQGVQNAVGGLFNKIHDIAGGIKKFLGFGSPTEDGPGRDSDTWMPNMMNMLVTGVVHGTPALSAAAHGAAAGVRGAFTSPSVLSAQGLNSSSAGVAGGSSGTAGVINFCVDGKVYTQIAVQGLSKELAASGIQRTLR